MFSDTVFAVSHLREIFERQTSLTSSTRMRVLRTIITTNRKRVKIFFIYDLR
jgi:hypothetical protein